jgi:predicted alpha/beta-hydrolase family hydrolase
VVAVVQVHLIELQMEQKEAIPYFQVLHLLVVATVDPIASRLAQVAAQVVVAHPQVVQVEQVTHHLHPHHKEAQAVLQAVAHLGQVAAAVVHPQ